MTTRIVGALVAAWLLLADPPETRDERGGGSNTIETLLLIALAIAVVAIAAVGIKAYVSSHLP